MSGDALSASALLLVLASAFVHASWNAILKRCADPEHAVLGGSLVSATFAVLVAVPFGFAFGRGSAVLWCFAAGLLEAAYFQTLGRALARGTLGLVYTVSRGGALLVVWPVSVLLLGETLTIARATGTFLVITGLAATGFSAPAKVARTNDAESRRAAKPVTSAFALAVLTGVFIGGYNLAYKKALAGGVSAPSANALSLATAAIINVIAIGSAKRQKGVAALRAQPIAIGIAGFLGATGFLMFLAALAQVGAGLIVTLRNTSILFAQALGFFLGERPPRIALVGTALVLVGALLLTGCAHDLERTGDACAHDGSHRRAAAAYTQALQSSRVYEYERRGIIAKRSRAEAAMLEEDSESGARERREVDLSVLVNERDAAIARAYEEATVAQLQRRIDDRATALMHQADGAAQAQNLGVARTLIAAAASASSPGHPARRRASELGVVITPVEGPLPDEAKARVPHEKKELRSDGYDEGHVGGLDHTELTGATSYLSIDGSRATARAQPRRSALLVSIAGGSGVFSRWQESNWRWTLMDTLGGTFGLGSSVAHRYRDAGNRAESRFAIQAALFYRALYGYRGPRFGAFVGAQLGYATHTIGEYVQKAWLSPAVARLEYRVAGPGVVHLLGWGSVLGDDKTFGAELGVPMGRTDALVKLGFEHRSMTTDAPLIVTDDAKDHVDIGLVRSIAVSAAFALGFE